MKSNWKPSPEQMSALKNIADGYKPEPFEWELLESLYRDLSELLAEDGE